MLRNWLILLWSLLSTVSWGQSILTWTPPDHPQAPFATQLRKVAIVIQSTCKDNAGMWSGKGTGFLVSYGDPRLPKGSVFQYLVTNRHVAECWDEDRKPRTVLSTALLLTVRNGNSQVVPIPGLHWCFPSDESADLAVATIDLAGELFDYLSVPLDAFFTKDLFATDNIGEGAKIILSGYFVQLAGETHVQPLIREGILSMIPDDRLVTTTGKRGSLYLADVHIFGGNSGSPVFISTVGIRGNTIQVIDDYRFLGVVSGYYFETSDFKLQIATTVEGKQLANTGVSMIVPADILRDFILNNPYFKQMRDLNIPTAPAHGATVPATSSASPK